jgi:hypothetical protein
VAATATVGGCRRTIVAGSAPAAGADVDGGGRRLVLLRRCGWAGVVMVVTLGGDMGLPAAPWWCFRLRRIPSSGGFAEVTRSWLLPWP